MARLTARGKTLVRGEQNIIPIGEKTLIKKQKVEVMYKDNGNLLKRTKTYYHSGLRSDSGKSFHTTGWVLDAAGLTWTATEAMEVLSDMGFKVSEVPEDEEDVSNVSEPRRLEVIK